MADVIGKKISELAVTTDLAGLYTIGSDKNNQSKKVPLQFIKEAADYANAQGDYAKGVGDTVQGNTGVDEYPVFSASTQYAAGSVVRYNDRLYRFTALHPAGAWVGTDAVETSIKAEADLKLTELSGKIDGLPIGDKFNSKGRYPSMTAGFANNLVGRGESTPEMFSFRASGGRSINDGAARIKTLRGNAVVWNQLFQPRTDDQSYNGNGVHFTDNRDGSYTISTDEGGATQRVNLAISITSPMNYAGHKLLITGCEGAKDGFGFWDSWSNSIGTIFTNNTIITAKGNGSTAFSVVIVEGHIVSQTTWKPRVIDLTKMFGQGNEPTSVEEFNAMLPLNVDLTAYNEGEVIPFNGIAIKSVGDNAWDEEWESGNFDNGMPIPDSTRIRSKNFIKVLPDQIYNSTKLILVFYYDDNFSYSGLEYDTQFTIPSNVAYIKFSYGGSMSPISTYQNDICISLAHSGYKEGQYSPYTYNIRNIDARILEMFPDGMQKWDKAYNKNGKGYVVKGTGVVDLGSLNYAAGTTGSFYCEVPPSAMKDARYSDNLLCGKYATWSGEKALASLPDKSLMLYNGASYPLLGIRDSAYTDATSFKAAMQGVMLYYELAEPQVYEFAEPFNLDYEVADFGTEEVIASKPSAPISADIIYQFNAVDSIRTNQAEIEKIKAALAKAGITIDL